MTKRGAIIAVQTSRGGMIALQLLCVFILISLLSSPSLAKGGGMNLHNTYDPQHITSLPLEVQKAIMRRCSSPRALHTFATYPENTQRIVLHFERFFCNEPDGFCKTTGECCIRSTFLNAVIIRLSGAIMRHPEIDVVLSLADEPIE